MADPLPSDALNSTHRSWAAGGVQEAPAGWPRRGPARLPSRSQWDAASSCAFRVSVSGLQREAGQALWSDADAFSAPFRFKVSSTSKINTAVLAVVVVFWQ